jgi:glycosyltransferase involved in cell wall biosynthesis
MHDGPLVSVIMNCYNSEKYLREAIDTVYAQTYANWEIIFWDNASTDNSAGIAKSYNAKLRYFRGDKTVPLGKARNSALGKASGDLIAFLDCDDLWMPDKLEKQVVAFNDPKVGIAYSDYAIFSDIARGERKRYGRSRMPSGYAFDSLLASYYLGLLTIVLRRTSLDGLSEWFDERFQVCEETDLFIRLAHDWDIAYCSEVLAKYRTHSQNWTNTRPELFWREYEFMISKYEVLYSDELLRNPGLLDSLKRSLVYGNAVTALKEGKNKEARRLALPYVAHHPKFILVFIFSFFSYQCLTGFLKLMNRSLPPV